MSALVSAEAHAPAAARSPTSEHPTACEAIRRDRVGTQASPAPVLALDGVAHHLDGRAVVDGVSLALVPGEVVVVVGPNGAGKTSLIRLAAGEVHPTRGRVLWNGTEAWRLPPHRLAATRAVMSQATSIGFPFPVEAVVALGFDCIGRRRSSAARSEAVARAIEAADIAHLVGRDVRTLSGGERQRTLFARALAQLDAGAAEVPQRALLLDEPVAALDLSHQIALMERTRALAATGVAVLAILHDLNLAAAFADRIVVMAAGRIAAEGAPAAVVTEAVLAEVFRIVPRAEADRPGAAVPVISPRHWHVAGPHHRS